MKIERIRQTDMYLYVHENRMIRETQTKIMQTDILLVCATLNIYLELLLYFLYISLEFFYSLLSNFYISTF